MYLSKVKSGIKEFNSVLGLVKSYLPESLCYLCQQPASSPVCEICEQDCLFFNTPVVPYNLLHWPPIEKGVVSGSYKSLFACGYYQWPLDQLIKQFKSGHPQLTNTLADWFVRYALPPGTCLPDCILPVPTSRWRFARRRYHQTQLLANAIARQLSLPVYPDWATRSSFQRKQQSLGRQARLNNLNQAYTIQRRCLPRHVAILDDVVTTGATAATLSTLLSQTYPGINIELWAIAVTPVQIDAGAMVSGEVRQRRLQSV